MPSERDIPTLKQLCFNYLLRNHDNIPKKVLQIYEIADIREEFISMAKRKHLVDDQFFAIFGEIFILSNSNIINNIQTTNNQSSGNSIQQLVQQPSTTSSSPITNQASTTNSNINTHNNGSNSFDDDNTNISNNTASIVDNRDTQDIVMITSNTPPPQEQHNSTLINTITNVELLNIKDIDLSGLPRITDISIQFLSKFNNLQNLDLSFSTGVSNDFIKHLAQNKAIQLHYLNLYYTNINDSTIASIALNYPNIKSLLIGGCHLLTDASVKSILKCQNLHHLDIAHCKKLTTSAIKTIALPQLLMLNASWCVEVSSNDTTYHKVIKACPKLTTLLIAASNVSEYQLSKILSEGKKLTNLDISFCLGAIPSIDSKLFKYFGNIQQLNISGCQFKEPIIKKILDSTPLLREIDLSLQDSLPWSLVDGIIKDQALMNHLHLINFSFSKFDRFFPESLSSIPNLTVFLPAL